MADLLIAAALLLMVAAAVRYIIKAKKTGPGASAALRRAAVPTGAVRIRPAAAAAARGRGPATQNRKNSGNGGKSGARLSPPQSAKRASIGAVAKPRPSGAAKRLRSKACSVCCAWDASLGQGGRRRQSPGFPVAQGRTGTPDPTAAGRPAPAFPAHRPAGSGPFVRTPD